MNVMYVLIHLYCVSMQKQQKMQQLSVLCVITARHMYRMADIISRKSPITDTVYRYRR